ALQLGSRIQKALSEPFRIAGRELSTGASVGIAMSTPERNRSEDLLRYADIAMYQAKAKTHGSVRLFDRNMETQATERCDLQNELRRALDRSQLRLHYQPIVSVRSGKIIGAEALVRWQRSENDLLLPQEFVPVAEELGLITDIGDWVLS